MRINRKQLAIAMIERDLNVNGLAQKCKVSRTTISNIKNGKSCSTETGLKIAKALGVNIDKLTITED